MRIRERLWVVSPVDGCLHRWVRGWVWVETRDAPAPLGHRPKPIPKVRRLLRADRALERAQEPKEAFRVEEHVRVHLNRMILFRDREVRFVVLTRASLAHGKKG